MRSSSNSKRNTVSTQQSRWHNLRCRIRVCRRSSNSRCLQMVPWLNNLLARLRSCPAKPPQIQNSTKSVLLEAQNRLSISKDLICRRISQWLQSCQKQLQILTFNLLWESFHRSSPPPSKLVCSRTKEIVQLHGIHFRVNSKVANQSKKHWTRQI